MGSMRPGDKEILRFLNVERLSPSERVFVERLNWRTIRVAGASSFGGGSLGGDIEARMMGSVILRFRGARGRPVLIRLDSPVVGTIHVPATADHWPLGGVVGVDGAIPPDTEYSGTVSLV